MDHGIGVVSGAKTCCLPMSCARQRTINHDRTTRDDQRTTLNMRRRHQPSPPAEETSGDSDAVSQACPTLRGYNVKNLYDVVANELLTLPGVPRTH